YCNQSEHSPKKPPLIMPTNPQREYDDANQTGFFVASGTNSHKHLTQRHQYYWAALEPATRPNSTIRFVTESSERAIADARHRCLFQNNEYALLNTVRVCLWPGL